MTTIQVPPADKAIMIRRTFEKVANGCGKRLRVVRKVVIDGCDSWAVWSFGGYQIKDTGFMLEIDDEALLERFNQVQMEMKYGW